MAVGMGGGRGGSPLVRRVCFCSMGLLTEGRNSYHEIVFHPNAISRFNQLGGMLRDRVRAVKKTATGPVRNRYTPYPVGKVGPEVRFHEG
jgi:hypothetical protein